MYWWISRRHYFHYEKSCIKTLSLCSRLKITAFCMSLEWHGDKKIMTWSSFWLIYPFSRSTQHKIVSMTLSSERKPSLYMIKDFVFDLSASIRETPGGSLNYPPLTWKRGFSVSWTIRWFSYLIGHNSGCTWPSLRLTLIWKLQLLQAEWT